LLTGDTLGGSVSLPKKHFSIKILRLSMSVASPSVAAFSSEIDPLGAALLDFLRGDHSARITVRSNLAEDDVLPVRYLFRSFPQFPEREKMALEACRGKVLDIGAGAGVHSLVLQERGIQVKALDRSAGAVEAMRIRGVREILQEDIFNLKGERFDTLLMLMNGIGLVGSLQGLDRFLLQAKSLLQPEGQILLESTDILYMYEQEDGSVLLDLTSGYYGQVEYQMVYKGHEGKPFNWLFIDFHTLADHAQTMGFACECLMMEDQEQYLARLIADQAEPG
jgi:SAM-dependent methyltransferase